MADMGQIHTEPALSPEEREFRDYITRGDDFCKIELFRYAVSYYRKAWEMRPDSEEARLRFQECRGRIKGESRVILIIAAVAAVILIAVLIIN
jgi:hypothetical protein